MIWGLLACTGVRRKYRRKEQERSSQKHYTISRITLTAACIPFSAFNLALTVFAFARMSLLCRDS
jgi:hypothetical protein